MTGGAGAGSPVVLDAAGGRPSEQVHDQLLAHVEAGRLRPGDRLPTVRGLAEQLGLSTATVAKAYRRLEAAGVTVTATRAGTVVRDPASSPAGSGDAAGAPVREAAGALARAAVDAGLDDAQALSLLRGALLVARRR